MAAPMTYREFLNRAYLSIGVAKCTAMQIVMVGDGKRPGCRVGYVTQRKAFDGHSVSKETAETLAAWALRFHGAVLDVAAMVMAPQKPPGRTDGQRAIDAIGRAFREAGVTDAHVINVTLQRKAGTWRIAHELGSSSGATLEDAIEDYRQKLFPVQAAV